MSLFETLGNFAKGFIPGTIDDVVIDYFVKDDTLKKVKEGLFPTTKEGVPAKPSFLSMRQREPEVGARRDISRIERLTGETQSRWTRFMTASIMQKFSEGNAVTSTPSSVVAKVRPRRSAKARGMIT